MKEWPHLVGSGGSNDVPLEHWLPVTSDIFAKVWFDDPEDADMSFMIGVLLAYVRR